MLVAVARVVAMVHLAKDVSARLLEAAARHLQSLLEDGTR